MTIEEKIIKDDEYIKTCEECKSRKVDLVEEEHSWHSYGDYESATYYKLKCRKCGNETSSVKDIDDLENRKPSNKFEIKNKIEVHIERILETADLEMLKDLEKALAQYKG